MESIGAKTFIGLCLYVAFCITACGQETHQVNDATKSCREFVAQFYAWYPGVGVGQKNVRKSDLALKSRPYLFSRELVRQLQEDSDAQEKAGSDLVSLDADPFIGADGVPERYIVKKVTVKNGRCWAEVHELSEGKESTTPDVTPELVLNRNRWIFMNFYFPSPSIPKAWNLLDELKAGRAFRTKYGSRGDHKIVRGASALADEKLKTRN
jgi:hypothetical protein